VNIQQILSDKIKQAMIAAGADENAEALVRQSGKPEFGDYQANGAMGAAKKLGINPREFAQKILDNLNLDGIAEKLEIAGPGFINIFLNKDWLANNANSALQAVNKNIRADEIALLEAQKSQTLHHLSQATWRLDSLRVIVSMQES